MRVSDRFNSVLEGRSGTPALVAVWNTGPFLNTLAGVPIREYYFEAEVKLRVQLEFIDRFPEMICLPGVWADFGALLEPSAFGCEIRWPSPGAMPMAQPLKLSESELARLRPIDPHKDGLMPQALDQYRYFGEHLDQSYIDEYGYLDGVAASFGPLELVAVLVGHANFFTLLLKNPELVHTLAEVTTESVISFLEAHQEVNGPLKRIALADHIPGQVSQELVEEFFLPYTNQVLETFPGAVALYHNEYPIPYPEVLAGLKADIFHFGGPISPLKKALGAKMTLMGNLDPVALLKDGTEAEIEAAAEECLRVGSPGGRFLLSSGGGIAPETPGSALAAMSRAAERYGRPG